MQGTNSFAVMLRAPLLDRRLLSGDDPTREADLRARAKRVCSRSRRDQLADGLERVLTQADAAPLSLTASAPVARDRVREEAPVILEIARRLRSQDPVDAQGVLLVRELLSDPGSPLSAQAPAGWLRSALRQANAALDPR
jgi:hypothetical protein